MPETENGFEIFHWRGQKRYRCPLNWESGSPCSYDTSDIEEMRKHVVQPHTRSAKKPAPSRVVSPLVDARGERIISEVPDSMQDIRFREEE